MKGIGYALLFFATAAVVLVAHPDVRMCVAGVMAVALAFYGGMFVMAPR